MAGQYFFKIDRNFLPLSGGTVSGNTYVSASLSANTFFSGSTNLEDLFLTSADISATTISSGTNIDIFNSGNNYEISVVNSPSFENIYFSGLSSGETYYVNNKIEPSDDNVSDIGTEFKRFRNINTVSGVSTFWTASTEVYTQSLNLGNDSLGNSRIIDANNSIIQNDTLLGGAY